MNDMSAVIVAKSDQWNADDFVEGPRTFTIEDVQIRPGTEQPVQIKLAGTNKFFRPCKTVSRILVAAWGADANVYRGRSVTLYTDSGVTWGGMKVGGIRVSHMSHIAVPLVIALQEKKGSRKMTTIQPLKVPHPDTMRQGIGIEEAAKRIADADTMDALRDVWVSDDVKPYQKQLKPDLDARKAALSGVDTTPLDPNAGEKRGDEDMGEAE